MPVTNIAFVNLQGMEPCDRFRKPTAWLAPIFTPMMTVAEDQRRRADVWRFLLSTSGWKQRRYGPGKVEAMQGVDNGKGGSKGFKHARPLVKPIGCTAGDGRRMSRNVPVEYETPRLDGGWC